MSDKFNLNFENHQEKAGSDKKDILVLRENEAFLGFVENFKSLQEDAQKEGIDISKAVNYLETGRGTPDLVESVLLELREKDVDKFRQAAERSGRLLSEKDITEIEYKSPYGKTLEDFRFFMGLPGMKKKVEAESASRPEPDSFERVNIKQILREERDRSEEWENKVIKAREEFQESMWDELRQYASFIREGVDRTPEIQKEINHHIDLLTEKAEEISAKTGIGYNEIFSEERDPDWYISQDYIKGGDFRPPSFLHHQ